ncbi:unnamed protein product [Protopolystoma xenopodis]|uniref:Uncharacterized protein n=1 Tax=Protopolystoma xenopodis TaxID=117903 RepID=A0A3S5B9P8_9PLAT|nr:unnamed protein product [Protopolystoma xenopodis]
MMLFVPKHLLFLQFIGQRSPFKQPLVTSLCPVPTAHSASLCLGRLLCCRQWGKSVASLSGENYNETLCFWLPLAASVYSGRFSLSMQDSAPDSVVVQSVFYASLRNRSSLTRG